MAVYKMDFADGEASCGVGVLATLGEVGRLTEVTPEAVLNARGFAGIVGAGNGAAGRHVPGRGSGW